VLKPLIQLVGGKWGGATAFENEITARVMAGDAVGAKAAIDRRLAVFEASEVEINSAINALVSAGAYAAALRIPRPSGMARTVADAVNRVLCDINLAEAEYNLGRWDAAQARLHGLDLAASVADITRAGLLQQRAWIAVHQGDGKRALELCNTIELRWLPASFHAEYYFTRAVALMALGALAEAEKAARTGWQCAERLSSERNALFILARLDAARGDWKAAERHCRAAAAHRFRTQGGEGLLLWAESLEQLGRRADAADARRLVRERDPESAAALSLVDPFAA
jgi:tetratricopeptide (TPR) repeat protein